uniref:Ribonuclease H-like domain-containing protein n=1 Tax=Tanacetum cinerariifolium TaxID=118510 RepID=A0A6L2L1C9_TANCI|nr:ribonuclease H-like domain-containing protein [Tanacetum cinerariifolium]
MFPGLNMPLAPDGGEAVMNLKCSTKDVIVRVLAWQIIIFEAMADVSAFSSFKLFLPPKTAEEVMAREREKKARTTLLMALLEDHLAKFCKMADAKEMFEAIKSIFGGNDKSKKMQKYLLKQQFEGFFVSTLKEFQTLLSQLEILGVCVSHKDANQKFLRSLPSFWSQVALIMRTKPVLDTLSFDDLYNNLRVFERDVKGTTVSSSNTQNMAFVSAENTSSTNDINDDDMEEMDLKWQGILLETTELKGTKTTEEEMMGTMETKLETMSVFMNKPSDLEDTPVNDRFADGMHAVPPLMTENYMPSGPDVEKDYSKFTYGLKQTSADESDSKPSGYASFESDSSVETSTSMPELVENASKVVCEPKVWTDAPIIKEYELDRKNIKETGITSHSPKIEKQDKNGHTRKVNAARQNYSSQAASTSTASKVNTARPFVNETRPKRNFYKTHSPNKRPFHNATAQRTTFSYQKVNAVRNKSLGDVGGNGDIAVKALTGCNWRYKRNSWNKVSNYNSGSKFRNSVKDALGRLKALKDKGIIDSGCSRHMTGNKAHLADYQEFKGGIYVTFGGSNRRITAPKVPSPKPSPEHKLPSPSNDPLPGERIKKLGGRFDRLEEENRVLKELYIVHSKFDTAAPVVKKEKSFKQGRIIAYIDEEVEINFEEAQAKPYKMDLEHTEKVLSMQDVDDEEPAEVKEVLEVVTVNAFIEKVKRSERLNDAVTKYQALKRKLLTEAQAKKNMIIYLKNMAGYKMNYFKRMTYSKIRPLFEKHYNYNQAFLEEVNKEITVPKKEVEVKGHKKEGESLEKEITKKQKIDEEAKELKSHL